jgi:hypothetical protein
MLTLVMVLTAGAVRAASVALIYSDEAALRSGKPFVGCVVSEGVVAPADLVLKSSDVLVGLSDDGVKKATLIRLDKDANVAVLRLEGRLLNPELQALHRKRAARLQALLPKDVVVDTTTATPPAELGQTLVSSGTPVFNITFNGAAITQDVIHFKTWLNKQAFSLELTAISTETLRNFTLRVHANPTLTFVNTERSLSRTLAPGYDFVYKYRSSVKAGKTFKFPLEARGVSAKDYEWIIEIKTDGHLQQQKVFVHFD